MPKVRRPVGVVPSRSWLPPCVEFVEPVRIRLWRDVNFYFHPGKAKPLRQAIGRCLPNEIAVVVREDVQPAYSGRRLERIEPAGGQCGPHWETEEFVSGQRRLDALCDAEFI